MTRSPLTAWSATLAVAGLLLSGACGSGPVVPITGNSLPDLLSAMDKPDLAAQGSGPDAGLDTVTLAMDSFVVPKGGEVYKCQDFVNPFGGDAEIQKFESHMAAGSHHVLLFYKQNVVANGALEDCSGLEFAATPYGSQRSNDSVTFPAGVAALIPGGTGLRIQSHYLNATQAAITATVQITFHKAAAGSVKDHAGVLFLVNPNLSIPSTGMPFTIAKRCRIPRDINLVGAGSHMHQHAVGFQATSGGNMIYQTTDWNEPQPAEFAPPMKLTAGSTVDFSCTWVNNTGTTLTFGESARTNEMCIFSAQFYPITGNFNILPCL